jgi:hypothetical protein
LHSRAAKTHSQFTNHPTSHIVVSEPVVGNEAGSNRFWFPVEAYHGKRPIDPAALVGREQSPVGFQISVIDATFSSDEQAD